MDNVPVVAELEPIISHKPKQVMEVAVEVAKTLKDVVVKAGLARKFGGDKEHLYYEAWQTVGGFFSHSVKTDEAMPVEIDGVKGMKARAILYNAKGEAIGGAEAYCMRDEKNWKDKPIFQLASMAQTRAGSKAFRNKFAWIATLGGYAPTPAEELDGEPKVEDEADKEGTHQPPHSPPDNELITDKQKWMLQGTQKRLSLSDEGMKDKAFKVLGRVVGDLNKLTKKEAIKLIGELQKEK